MKLKQHSKSPSRQVRSEVALPPEPQSAARWPLAATRTGSLGMSGDITPGAKVRFHGLGSRTRDGRDLNGTIGEVKRWEDGESRWRVRYEVEVEVDGQPKTLFKFVNAKEENLSPVEDAPEVIDLDAEPAHEGGSA